MNPKVKNAIIFIVIGIIIVSIYVIFIQKDPVTPNLTVSSPTGVITETSTTSENTSDTKNVNTELSKDFLSVLLSIQNISLDDSIFSNTAFMHLKDSTIVLSPDGSEGRPNPFAPIGAESNLVPASALTGFGQVDDTLNANENDLLQVNPEDANTQTPKTTPTKPIKKQ
jgi:hypothetical protein